MTESQQHEKSCSSSGFNYCFWAKFIVGVPAVFIIGGIASLSVENPMLQIIVGAAAAIFAVWVAMEIDKIPALQKKIIKK